MFAHLRTALAALLLATLVAHAADPNLSVGHGGTGASTAAAGRANLGAAASGANSDITSLNGLTTPIPMGGGGTGANSPAAARANLGAAAAGSNSDITSLNGLTTPVPTAGGGTGASSPAGARANLGAAAAGSNSDITSLNGLTTPVPTGGGGTGANSAAGARANLGAAGSGANSDITSLSGLTTPVPTAGGGTGSNSPAGARANLGAAAAGANSDITSLNGLTTPVPMNGGGTGSNSPAGARANLGAAASGANSDITSIGGLTTPLSLPQGGVGATTAAGARSNLGAAASGANSDITSIGGLTTPLSLPQGGVGATTAAGARSNLGAAASGANSDITSIGGLTTPLSLPQGGVGATTAAGARSNLGAAASGANSDITSIGGLTTPLSLPQGGVGATTAAGARSNLGAAAAGSNSDITSLNGLTTPVPTGGGGTGANSAAGARANLGAAGSGANSDITSLAKLGSYSILESGAYCDAYGATPHDDTTALQTWLNSRAVGSTVVFPPNTFCKHNSDLTLPNGVKFQSLGLPIGNVNQGGNPQGGGFVHPGSAHIYPGKGNLFDNMGVWRSLDDGCFHITPTVAQALADVACWWNDYSQGISLKPGASSSGFSATGTLFVEGFHWGVYNNNSSVTTIANLKGDDTVCLGQFGTGDINIVDNIRCETFYSGALTITGGAWQREGTCIYLNGGGAYVGRMWQCEGWPMALVMEATGGNRIDTIQHEYAAGTATSPSGYPAETCGVTVHAIGNNIGNVLTRINGNSDNQNATPLVYCDTLDVDSGPYFNTFEKVVPGYIPAGGTGVFLGGNTDAPITEQITAITTGTPVTLTIDGATIDAFGGPYTVSYTPTSSDTPATVAVAIEALCNTQWSALAHAHISCLNTGYAAGSFGIYFQFGATVTATIGGATYTAGTGTAVAGTTGKLNDVNIANNTKSGAALLGNMVVLGTANARASGWMINGVYWSAVPGNPLPTNWLSYALKPYYLFTSNIQWSAGSTTNLGGTGGASASVGPNAYDNEFTVTGGTSSTGFTYTFTTPFPDTPNCRASSTVQITSKTVSATAVTIGYAAATGAVTDVTCDFNVHL